jgi:hypothetical protein
VKTIYSILILAFIAILPFSCSDDFLKKDNQFLYETEDPIILSSQSGDNKITLTIQEAGNGEFHISVYPKWLVLETMNGTFENGSVTLKYTINQPVSQSQVDYLTGTLIISAGDIGLFKTTLIYGNIGADTNQSLKNIIDIEGRVVDVAYNKIVDKMVIATQNPNRLLVTQTTSGTSTVINLDKSPQCMEISQDGKNIVVGYSIAELTVFNLVNNMPLRDYPIDCVPFDIALGQNGWCYISPSETLDFNLRSLNLETGELNSGKNPPLSHWLYGKSELMKIKGKPLLASKGLLLVDISKVIPNDTIDYWADGAEKIWPLNDGSRYFTPDGQCYFLPDYVGSLNIQFGIKTYGRLTLNQLKITSIDQCEAKNSIFVAERNVAEMYYNMNGDNIIEQFNATNLNSIKIFYPSMTAVKTDGATVPTHNEVHYVFTNNSGTKLFAIRAYTTNIDVKHWSVETFDLN